MEHNRGGDPFLPSALRLPVPPRDASVPNIPMPNPSIDPVPLDPAMLAKLRALGGQTLLDRIIEAFLADTPGRVAAAEAGIAEGSAEAVGRAGHSLISSAGQLGATRLSERSRELESLARQGMSPALAAATAAWRLEYDAACQALRQTRAGGTGRRRLAVVEDNPDNRLLLGALLGDRYDITEYSDGPAALAGLPGLGADLVLLDISLPVMDGPEVLRRLRAAPALAGVPVIALTAHAMAGDRERFLAAGFDGYIAKPIVDETLLYDTIARLLSERGATG